MPTYEYKCTKGHTFEAFQSIMDEPLTKCPECRSAVRRVINGGMGVIFKGSGFYSTDNKRGSALSGANGNSKDKDKSSEGSNGGSSSSSSEKSSEKSSTEKSSEKSSSKEKTAAS
jgi:putative FmdB family regulatory protein